MERASSIVATRILGFGLVLLLSASVEAAELQVLAGGAIAGPLRDLAAQFKSASGHKLVFRFGTTPELIKLAATGGPFDMGVVPREVLEDPAARAQFASGTTTDIARVGLGVAVRSGARKPDISTPETFKRTLLEAESIATIPASATGAQVLRVFELLHISDAMKRKIRAQPTPARVVEVVRSGEAQLGVFLLNVLTAPGLEVIGPFPTELQQQVVFAAAVAASTREAEAAKSFITFLKTPAATAVIKARGMNPG